MFFIFILDLLKKLNNNNIRRANRATFTAFIVTK